MQKVHCPLRRVLHRMWDEVMDIQKERAAFEASGIFLKSLFDNVYWDEWNNKYAPSVRDKKFCDNASRLNDGFLGWRAAKTRAIPEGFVLVPKEIPDHVVQRLENSSYHWGDSTRDYFAPIYEMMIEAAEGE